MLGRKSRLLGLILFRHFLGVAAGGFGLLELFVLDRKKLGAETFDLLLDRGPHIGRGDDGAKPPRSRDCLQAGDADAHHEHFGRWDGARRGHHHGKSPPKRFRRLDHRAVARQIGLA